jgi:hypothetical protein
VSETIDSQRVSCQRTGRPILAAIANHEETEGVAVSPISAAVMGRYGVSFRVWTDAFARRYLSG